MRRHGWTLLFHPCVEQQLEKLVSAVKRSKQRDPEGVVRNANFKPLRALSNLMLEAIPANPGATRFRQGNTLGAKYRHWRRAKFGGRFRLFFRYDDRAKIIVYGWVNDTHTQRAAGSQSDPYRRFKTMLERGDPPTTWSELLADSSRLSGEMIDISADGDLTEY